MKKLVSCLLAVLMMLTFLPVVSAAGTANITVSASSTNPTVGNQISFYVNFSGSDIGSYEYALNYDTTYLEYVGFSGDGDGNAAGGKFKATGVFDNNVGSIKTTVTFKTKKAGSTNISISGIVVASGVDFEEMTVNGGRTSSITIAAKPEASTDNTLKSLSTSPVGITPAFSPNVTDYSVQVDYSVTKLVVSAAKNHSKASVSVSGADNLKVGENTVKVVCTAESGATKTYIIKVTRKASDYAGVTAVIGGESYTIGYDVNSLTIPQGYAMAEASFEGKKILSFASANGQLTLVWLINSQNQGAWYTYDAATETFAKYVEVSTAPGRYVLLDMPSTVTLPEGFATEPTDITIGGIAAKGYIATDPQYTDFYLVYAMAPAGEKGLYIFDQSQGTMQRYFTAGSVQVVVPPVDEPAEEPDEEPKEEPKEDEKSPVAKYVLLGVAALLFIGGVVMLILLLKKPAYKRDEDIDTRE